MAMDMNVALKITAGVTGQQAVDQLRTSMDKLNGAADAVGKGFGVAKAAVGAFVALEAVQAVVSFARETINAADRLDEMAERTGLAVDVLSELDYAAKMNGRSLEDVQAALNRVAVKATDAATGNKTAALAFDALGVSVKNTDGSMRSSLEITQDIGAAFRGIQDPTLKAALAVEMFGKSGPALVPLIEKMEDARAEARDLGAVVGPEFAASAAEFNDNMDRMAFMARGFAGAILEDVLPAMSQMFNEYRAGVKAFGSFGSALYNLGTQNPFKTNAEHAEYYYNRIGELEKEIGKLDAAGTAYATRNAANLREELDTVRRLSQYYDDITNTKRAGAGRGFINPENVKPDTPDAASILARIEAEKRSQELAKEGQRIEEQRRSMLQSLNDEVDKLVQGEDALFIAKLRRLGATDQEIAQAETLLRQRAHQRDLDAQLDDAIKEQTKNVEEAARSKEKLAEAGRRVFEETRTPVEQLNAELTRLNDLLQRGAIDWDTYERATNKAQDAFEATKDVGKNSMEELKQAVEGWGRQATDAFVEFAFTGKSSFKDMVNSILQDIARMLIQQKVMQPLMNSIMAAFPFANGGVMTDSGPLPLKAYASGGIANSPQLALFGEGRMPEAYVPLPDGRTIPVTMTGDAGGSTNVVVNVNVESGQTQVSDQGAGNLGRLIAGAVKAELINQKRPGGLLAA